MHVSVHPPSGRVTLVAPFDTRLDAARGCSSSCCQVAIKAGSKGAYFLQRTTKWGAFNHSAGNIRLNTELVKKPKDLLEYIVVHEMLHLIEPTHSERYIFLLTEHYPTWREARAELNELPLTAGNWNE